MAGKPFHAGHYGLVEIASKENDEVQLFVSTTDRKRPGELPIYGADMLRVWKRFLEPIMPSNAVVKYCDAPVKELFKELEAADASGDSDTVFSIYSDSRDIVKYNDAVLKKSAPRMFDGGQIVRRSVDRNETVNISGTMMRDMLARGDTKNFGKFLPPPISGNAVEIIDMLKRSK